ncbi:MAG: AAA family ATPase [Actinobacteria bacterium]|nr:AAA family ATPase [Actinomycetota bacterium]
MSELPSGTVTFLFTDIEGSTRLLEQLRDRYADVLAEHHRVLREAVARFAGHEVDTQGDAFFVAFSRAGKAVGAAVAAQRALMTLTWPEGVDVRVRMGLDTGEPTVGGDRYVGLRVHRAARICSAGHGGQILLSSATRELVEDDLPPDVVLRDLGERRLKDFERPERLFQLVVEGLEDRFLPLKASEAVTDSFVGRERELAELERSLEQALGGRGHLVLVDGEAGIGKSLLADEFARRARAAGAHVFWGRSWEAGGAPAYWPWVQALRAYVRDARPESLRADLGTGAADIAQLVPELRELVADLPAAAAGAESGGARFRLFDSIAGLLRNASRRRPLVIVLDDLHAADEPSLLLLQFLAPQLTETRVVVLGMYRETELEGDHPLRPALAEFARAPGTLTLSLAGLTRADVPLLIERISGTHPAEGVSDAIHGETEGNPLFVVEVVRLLVAEGTLHDVGEGRARRVALPAGVREVIDRRLRRLSEDARRLLTLASVLGREFTVDVLAAVSEVRTDAVLDLLDDALAARLLTEAPGAYGRLRFSHALVREALYDELSQFLRIRLHRRAGEALEGIYSANVGPHLAELAHHFFKAAPGGEVDKALEYGRRAGEQAVNMTAYEEATRLYRMGLELLDLREPPDEELRCELLLRLGDSRARAGDMAGAKETFLEAATLAKTLNLAEQLGRAALGYGGRFVWEAARGDPHLLPLLEDALRELPEVDSHLRAKVLARLAAGPLRDDIDRKRRDVLSREAVEMARRLGDPATLAFALDGRYNAVWSPENLDERLDLSFELVSTATEAADKERALQAHHYRALALLEAGDIPGVYAELDAKAKLAEDLRQPAQRWYLASVRATLATFQGRFEEAEELIPQAFALGERAQGSIASIYRVIHLHALRDAQGRLDEHEEPVRRAVADFPTYVVLRCILAHLYGELQREREASALLEALAADDFAALPMNEEWLFGMSLLADVAAAVGNEGQVAAMYEVLLPYADLNAVSAPDSCRGSVSRNLGSLAARLGRRDAAMHHFDDALAMNARADARPWVAQTQYDYARMLHEVGGPDNTERTLQLLADCRRAAGELGMRSLLERASRLDEAARLGRPST